ncbi:hypothetical protein SDC9_169469 [bioreactor metagenome]|uniref:Uncharacterized protein n=1 Tax=bioreactor metagenome TaxID=1076179 RepID=A0A645G7H0_9ZZZZ
MIHVAGVSGTKHDNVSASGHRERRVGASVPANHGIGVPHSLCYECAKNFSGAFRKPFRIGFQTVLFLSAHATRTGFRKEA